MNVLGMIRVLEEEVDVNELESVIDDSVISPGMGAFIAILLLAVASILLLVSMVRRLRRVRYREEVRAEIAEELAERDRGEEPDQRSE